MIIHQSYQFKSRIMPMKKKEQKTKSLAHKMVSNTIFFQMVDV